MAVPRELGRIDWNFRILVLVCFLLGGQPANANKRPQFTDAEIIALGSAQYAELQSFVVESCRSRFGVDHTALLRQFDARYGEFFSTKILEARKALSLARLSYDDFVSASLRGIPPTISADLCNVLNKTLTARIADVVVVENGIDTQVRSLRAELQN